MALKDNEDVSILAEELPLAEGSRGHITFLVHALSHF